MFLKNQIKRVEYWSSSGEFRSQRVVRWKKSPSYCKAPLSSFVLSRRNLFDSPPFFDSSGEGDCHNGVKCYDGIFESRKKERNPVVVGRIIIT
jgi:hypothetical protein